MFDPVFEFKTKPDRNGNQKYLAIDTTNERFTRFCRSMIPGGITINHRAYRDLLSELRSRGFEEADA